jgi:hypothetical protein
MSLSDVAAIVAAVTALLGLLVGYIQLVLPRSLLPCIEFDVDFVILHRPKAGQWIGEVVCVVKNVGPGVGYVTNVQCRVSGWLADASGVHHDGVEPPFTYHVRAADRAGLETPVAGKTGRLLLAGDVLQLAAGQKNFIQPGVTQRYRKPLALPADLGLVHIWGAFDYHFRVGTFGGFVSRITRQARDASPRPYTVRRTFSVA